MNEEQYRQICECCDDLLNGRDTSLVRISIPWLHVLSEHPASLVQYLNLFAQDGADFMGGVKRSLGFLWKLRPGPNPKPHLLGAPRLPEKTDVLIFSHLLNNVQLSSTEDFYFGHLVEELDAIGVRAVVAMRNHTGMSPRRLSQCGAAESVARILLTNSLGWIVELGLANRLRKEAAALRRAAATATSELRRRVAEGAAAQALSSSSLETLGLYKQVQDLVTLLQPKSILVTYEGHAWERIVFAAARSVNPSIRCVGYQHAILFPRQHAIKRPLGVKYDPDIICTAGPVTRGLLCKLLPNQCVPVVAVGTPKQANRRVSPIEKLLKGPKSSCLVIPDGTMSECNTILNFVITIAQAAPDIEFIVRMHPVMPFELVVSEDARFRSLPENISISNKSIQEDFDRTRWAIYRGTGAVIHAVVAGLRPFYFRPAGEHLGIDPLCGLETWRYVVTSVPGILAHMRMDMASNSQALTAEWAAACEYCAEYFSPINYAEFIRCIECHCGGD